MLRPLMFVACSAVASTNSPALRWHPDSGLYDAAIPGWPVERVLSRLGGQTGWRVFIEPGAKARVRTRFAGLTARDALPRLVGGLDFSLTTASNGSRVLRVFKSSVASAGAEIVPAAEGVRDELIIRLRPGTKTDAATLAKLVGGSVTGTNAAAGAYRLKFASEDAADAGLSRLASETDVAGVENNFSFFPPEQPVPIDGASMPPLRLNPAVNPDGSRRVIALIDTAVQNMSPEFSRFLLPSVEMVPGSTASTTPTHGTTMVETMVRGMAAASKDGATTTVIRPYDVYGASPTASTWDVARGVTQAVQDGATIINLSLGSTQDSPYLRDVVRSISDQGAMVLAAAGNDGSREAFYPAAYDQSFAVTATSGQGRLASYANRGPFVDIAVPGTTVVTYTGLSWAVQGTSVSSAFAAGVAGVLGQSPSLPLASVRQAMLTAFPFSLGTGP